MRVTRTSFFLLPLLVGFGFSAHAQGILNPTSYILNNGFDGRRGAVSQPLLLLDQSPTIRASAVQVVASPPVSTPTSSAVALPSAPLTPVVVTNTSAPSSSIDFLAIGKNLADLQSLVISRKNLGLGSIATQDANNVNIEGGSITGITALLPKSGGTGLSGTPKEGQLLIGTGNGYSLATLTAGSGVTINSESGKITISRSSSSSGVDSVNSLSGDVTITAGSGVSVSSGAGTVTVTNAGVTALNSLTGGLSIAGSGINSVSAGSGTVTISGTEADTLSAVTGRGATSAEAITLSNSSNSITAGTLTATGGSANGVAIGASNPSTGVFTTVNGLAITNNGTNTLSIAAGKTLQASNSLTLAGTDGTTMTFPGSSGTVATLDATQTLTNKTLTTPSISSISNTGTLTLPTSTDTLVGRATTDTLTNKTLTAPVIATISNTGTLTLPTATDTLVGRATTDTLTNKTIAGSSNTITGIPKLCSNTSIPSGNTITNTTTETAFASTCTIAANTLSAGDVIRIKLWGVYSNTLTPPTVTQKIKMGSTTLASTGAVTTGASASDKGWSSEMYILVLSTGASGTIDAQGYAEYATAATTALTINNSNASALSIDTTTDQAISATMQWSVASSSDTVTLRHMVVEVLK